jgi:hypothetical protein
MEAEMDQARVVIDLSEGIIELEGPVEFVRQYLERYAPAATTADAPEGKKVAKRKAGGKVGGRVTQRACTRAINAEVKAGFFERPRSAKLLKERLVEKGVTCSVGTLRKSLKKAVDQGQLETSGRGRGLVYRYKAEAATE